MPRMELNAGSALFAPRGDILNGDFQCIVDVQTVQFQSTLDAKDAVSQIYALGRDGDLAIFSDMADPSHVYRAVRHPRTK